jgi:predicted RNase H-like HicB family nuclease
MLRGMKKIAKKSPRRRAVINLKFDAVIRRSGKWWIGWVEKVPGVNCQEKTRAALLKTLRIALAEALDFHLAEVRWPGDGDYREQGLAMLRRVQW